MTRETGTDPELAPFQRPRSADGEGMDRSRAVVAVGFGIVAVGLAVAAVVTDEAYLVLLAAVAAMGAAAVASEASR